MKGVGFVLRSAGPAAIAMGAIGLASTACNGGLIAVVHRALGAERVEPRLALSFALLAFGKLATAYASGRIAESYSQASVAELRRELLHKLLAVPLLRFEQVGAARAFGALTSDVEMIHASLQATAQAMVSAAVLVGGAGFLLSLDPRAFLALACLFALGAFAYRTMSRRARVLLARGRDEYDRLLRLFGDLTSGVRELKLHEGRRRALLDGPIFASTEQLKALELAGASRYLLGQAVNGLLVLTSIFAVLFALPFSSELRSSVVSGYVLTGLYLAGPLSSLLQLMPLYAALEIALRRVEEIGIELGAGEAEPACGASVRPSFARIELCDVVHRYAESGGFELGPLALAIAPAEIVFITGGNGSGKSTLGKVLSGLYPPASGSLRWDGREVGRDDRDLYRQLWSAVFSEFHVFDRLYGLGGPDLDQRANAWLSKLDLASSTEVRDGALTTVELSSGQRKRLALLTALLEDRPIYLFDEWASDQDPEFKQVFYRSILPELKARGKAVVVITHDDRFFGLADRVVQLDRGRIARETSSVAR